jgi:hypothetical protein
MIEDEVAVVIERELALLTPEVRGFADQLEELLDPDFEEIGKSGRLWTRSEMIAALVADAATEQHSISFSDMSGRMVGPGFVPNKDTRPSRHRADVRRSRPLSGKLTSHAAE